MDRWELSTSQAGGYMHKRWLGVGENCSLTASSPRNWLCRYVPFQGPQGVPDGKYRHTAEGGAVEQVLVHGKSATRDPLYFQAAPFQIVGFEPDDGVDVYDVWWGSYGGEAPALELQPCQSAARPVLEPCSTVDVFFRLAGHAPDPPWHFRDPLRGALGAGRVRRAEPVPR
jgi:hypothetical protein